jgi:hypothetical protein
MIGSIMYLVTSTQPDLIFGRSFLREFSSTTNKQYVVSVNRCLRYIKGTQHLTLLFPSGSEMFIAGFRDSDYGNCMDSRQSISGYLYKLGNSTISWLSQKQKSVSTSTMDAEYVAISKAVQHFL